MSDEEKAVQESKQPPAEQANCGPCLRKIWRVFRWFLPVIALIYLSLVFRVMWNIDKGARLIRDPTVMTKIMDGACTEYDKHVLGSQHGETSPWTLDGRKHWKYEIHSLDTSPECLAYGILVGASSGANGNVDFKITYYDRASNLPIAKVTIEYLNPRRL